MITIVAAIVLAFVIMSVAPFVFWLLFQALIAFRETLSRRKEHRAEALARRLCERDRRMP